LEAIVALLFVSEISDKCRNSGMTEDSLEDQQGPPLVVHSDEKGTVPSDLFHRIAMGHDGAVEECLERYGDLVWSLASRWFPNKTDAEDACQEIFVELWRSAHRYDLSLGSEVSFIVMIARRRLIDRLRKSVGSSAGSEVDLDGLQDAQEPIGVRLEVEDEAKKAARCLEKLPLEQQQILKLAIHSGSSHSKISEYLSIPLGTVKTSARRGLIQIRDCMARANRVLLELKQ
jgi:RNA polymerase sigma factor (sigma-70 family)